jgi:hypothetical protein
MTTQTDTFYVYYDGPAHKKNDMDIRAVALRLSGLGDLLYETHALVNGNTPIDVKVQAGFVKGSFGFEVHVIQELIANSKDILPLIGLGGTVAAATLLEVIQLLKGRSIDKVITEDGKSQLLIDEEKIECSEDIEKVLSSPTVRKAVDSMVHQAMLQEGTDIFCIKDDKNDAEPIISINKTESTAYKAPRKLFRDKETSKETEAQVTFLTAHADKKTNWRITHLGEEYSATIKDDQFMNRLTENNVPNLLGQKFTVQLEVITKEKAGSEPTKRYVIKKIYHASVSKS